MGLFDLLFGKKKQPIIRQDNNVKPIINKKPLPLYDNVVKVDCFDIHIKKHPTINIGVGDNVDIWFEDSAISNVMDAVVCFNNVKIGYLQHKEAKWLRKIFGKTSTFDAIVDNVVMDNKPSMFIKIKLPYVQTTSNLPCESKLAGVMFDNRQSNIKQCVVGCAVTAKNEPSQEYPNTIKVYCDNLCIGVLPDDVAIKLIKKFKANCVFDGVISSIFGNDIVNCDVILLNNK